MVNLRYEEERSHEAVFITTSGCLSRLRFLHIHTVHCTVSILQRLRPLLWQITCRTCGIKIEATRSIKNHITVLTSVWSDPGGLIRIDPDQCFLPMGFAPMALLKIRFYQGVTQEWGTGYQCKMDQHLQELKYFIILFPIYSKPFSTSVLWKVAHIIERCAISKFALISMPQQNGKPFPVTNVFQCLSGPSNAGTMGIPQNIMT